jgi:hypothetical protein
MDRPAPAIGSSLQSQAFHLSSSLLAQGKGVKIGPLAFDLDELDLGSLEVAFENAYFRHEMRHQLVFVRGGLWVKSLSA